MILGTIYIMSQASYKIDSKKNILILGESYSEAGIDDNLFNRSINLSQSGTAYLYSYVKLEKLLEENKHIDTVLVSFRYDLLTKDREDLWIMSEDFLVPKVAFCVTLLGKEEFSVYNDKKILSQAILKVPIRNMGSVIKYFHKGRSNFTYRDLRIGGFLKSNRQRLQKDIEKGLSLKPTTEEESPVQKKYLLKIMSCCKKHNVKLILINLPMYKPEIYGCTDKLYEYHNKYLKDVEFWDYSNFSFSSDSCYGDLGHLNYKGALVFSNYLQKYCAQDNELVDSR